MPLATREGWGGESGWLVPQGCRSVGLNADTAHWSRPVEELVGTPSVLIHMFNVNPEYDPMVPEEGRVALGQYYPPSDISHRP